MANELDVESAVSILEPLSHDEAMEFGRLEGIISRGIQVFVAVGNALIEIRDNKYYRGTHASFATYCRDRWDLSKSHAYRLIQSAEVSANLSGVGPPPTSERQLRPLVGLPPDQQREAWRRQADAPPPPPKPKKPRPTRPEIRAVAKAAEIREFLDAGIEPEPADIVAQRKAGIIPDGVAVEIYDPFAFDPNAEDGPVIFDDEDELDMPGELTDDEYLSHCPARKELSDVCRLAFDQDALLYRDTEAAKRTLHATISPLLKKNRRRGRTGHHHSKLTWFLKTKHPKHWTVCPDCKGTGHHELIGKCPRCKTFGYEV